MTRAYRQKRITPLSELPAGVSWEPSPVFDWLQSPWKLLSGLERNLLLASWVASSAPTLVPGRTRMFRVLDVGCGFGELGHLLAAWRFPRGTRLHYQGLDADPDKIRIGKDLHPSANLVVGLAQSFDAGLSAWDVVYSSEVLEHLSRGDGNSMLRRLWDHIRPGGRLVLGWATPELSKHRSNPWHLCERGLGDVRDILESRGLVVERAFHIKVHSRHWGPRNPNLPNAMQTLFQSTLPSQQAPGASAVLIGRKEH